MAVATNWTAAIDNAIRTMRKDGRTWRDIGQVLTLSRDAVRLRGKDIGAWRPAEQKKRIRIHPTPTRDAYPPGHPETWGAITAGTLLAGVPYPIQPLVTRAPPEERDEWEANMAERRMAA